MPTKQSAAAPKKAAASAVKKAVAPKKATPATATKKRAAVKPAASRARRSSTAAKKPARPVVAEPERSFWTTDGQIFRSLEELAVAFGSMEETVFVYHANGDKNDFALWVEHVLEDPACAADLRKAKNAKKAHLVTLKHVSLYSF